MRFERDAEPPLVVEVEPDGEVVIHRDHPEEAVCSLDEDDLRWLMHVGIPAALAVPSDPAVKVRDASTDAGQLRGQLAFE